MRIITDVYVVNTCFPTVAETNEPVQKVKDKHKETDVNAVYSEHVSTTTNSFARLSNDFTHFKTSMIIQNLLIIFQG